MPPYKIILDKKKAPGFLPGLVFPSINLLISIYHAILELLRSAPAVLCAESLIASRIYLIVPSSKLNEL